MAAGRDIKRRIKSVKNTRQITKAMEMVAASKLRNTQAAAQSSKPYAIKLEEVLSHLVGKVENSNSPLLQVREPKSVCFYIISADRGLAGGYNASLLRFAKNEIDAVTDKEVGIITVGRKAKEFFKKRNYKINKEILGVQDFPTLFEAQEIAAEIIASYCECQYDEIRILYTDFLSTVTHIPTNMKILPIDPPEATGVDKEYILEPHEEELLDKLLPMYFKNQVYRTLLQSKASEHASRMTAMNSATKNAGEMISKLNLKYNRARQAAITTEIAEIVGGANALKG